MTEPQRHDWQVLIADIRATGVTPYKLALALKIDKKTLAAYAAGRQEPRHSVGELILALHRDIGEKITTS